MHAANVDNAMHTSLLKQKYAELWLYFLSCVFRFAARIVGFLSRYITPAKMCETASGKEKQKMKKAPFQVPSRMQFFAFR
ncbi:hypothetical protein C0557_08235 [Kosakonia sp. MUSA4]|nr:hypothetical protein C0557_08235 [Kosakonia sp. MUSA4]